MLHCTKDNDNQERNAVKVVAVCESEGIERINEIQIRFIPPFWNDCSIIFDQHIAETF